METPTTIAKNLLKDITWIDELYSGSIPSNVEVNTNKNTVLITEYLNEPSQYANMEIKYWLVGVEGFLFFKKFRNGRRYLIWLNQVHMVYVILG